MTYQSPVLTRIVNQYCDPLWLFGAASVLSFMLWWECRNLLKSKKWRNRMINHNIFGIDINKTTLDQRRKIKEQINSVKDPEPLNKIDKVDTQLQRFIVPESAGLVGILYIFHVMALLLLCPNTAQIFISLPAACIVILLALFLGWIDDVLEVGWSEKVVYSIITTLPILLAYTGSTYILVPKPFQHLTIGGYEILGTNINLGILYLFYMSLWCVFCTNSINILAGINGLEVGQSLVIGVSLLVHHSLQYYRLSLLPPSPELAMQLDANTVSILFLVPFIALCIALWQFNRYPAQWFIGDTFTYFAGTVLACAAISGHSTKTEMLFFVPQLINFIISIPQLAPRRFRSWFPFWKECPRHRLPKWNQDTNKLENSGNYTLLNAYINFFGPQTEKDLCRGLLIFQVICCLIGFFVRYYMAGLLYDEVH